MNDVNEAHCEMLEEPMSIVRPNLHTIEADSYEPLPRLTTPFRMPVVEPDSVEGEPIVKAIQPALDESQLSDLEEFEGDLHFVNHDNFQELSDDDDFSMH